MLPSQGTMPKRLYHRVPEGLEIHHQMHSCHRYPVVSFRPAAVVAVAVGDASGTEKEPIGDILFVANCCSPP